MDLVSGIVMIVANTKKTCQYINNRGFILLILTDINTAFYPHDNLVMIEQSNNGETV